MSHGNPYRTEEDLFDGICRDAPGAFEAFFEQHADLVHGLAVKVTGNEEASKTILRETMIRSLGTIDALKHAKAMERHVLKEACGLITEHKKGGEGDSLEKDGVMPALENGQLGPITDWSLDPEEESRRNEEKQAIREMIAAMPLDNSLVVVLHDIEEVSQKDLAEIFQVPVKTIKERLHLGRLSLRKGITEKLGSG